MASRHAVPDSLDFFPTPPWATRALCEIVLPHYGLDLASQTVWEPACGAGHMSEVLAEYADRVIATDVHDYGARMDAIGSFVGSGPDVVLSHASDWVITNPPFSLAEAFLERARTEARGVALLLRTAWLEGQDRYENIFAPERPRPSVVALFSERVPMVKGRWDPKASTATSYAWMIWRAGTFAPRRTELFWIPPGQRKRLTNINDVAKFAGEAGT